MGSVRNMRTINYYVISNNKGYIDSNIKNVLDISSSRYKNSNCNIDKGLRKFTSDNDSTYL